MFDKVKSFIIQKVSSALEEKSMIDITPYLVYEKNGVEYPFLLEDYSSDTISLTDVESATTYTITSNNTSFTHESFGEFPLSMLRGIAFYSYTVTRWEFKNV